MTIIFEVAYCSQCGLKCVIDDQISKKRNLKVTAFDKVIGFFERQQNIRKDGKRVLIQKQEEREQIKRERIKKYWWIVFIVILIIYIVIMIMAMLE